MEEVCDCYRKMRLCNLLQLLVHARGNGDALAWVLLKPPTRTASDEPPGKAENHDGEGEDAGEEVQVEIERDPCSLYPV